jgi:hypothetical protein
VSGRSYGVREQRTVTHPHVGHEALERDLVDTRRPVHERGHCPKLAANAEVVVGKEQ